MNDYAIIKFSDSYHIAGSVWQVLFESSQDEIEALFEAYFCPCCEDRAQRLAKPSRWTLLHHFIHCFFWDSYEAFEHHRDDMRDLIIGEYVAVLDFYELPYPAFDIPDEMSDDYERETSGIISRLRSLLPSARITHDTFHLLFGDRIFLLRFSQEVARVIRECMKKQDYQDLVERDGVLQRVYLPEWVKRAVFYRDKGRCVICGKDLTGTVFTGEEVHYDHIVPLAEGGSNDPTNFQVMCRDCNLRKSQQMVTSDIYQTYWNLDKEVLGEVEAYTESRTDSPGWAGVRVVRS